MITLDRALKTLRIPQHRLLAAIYARKIPRPHHFYGYSTKDFDYVKAYFLEKESTK